MESKINPASQEQSVSETPQISKKKWGEDHYYIIYDWGNNHMVGRFSSLQHAKEHMKRYAKSYDTWRVYRELKSLRKH